MAKFKCETHGITLEITNGERRFSRLNWSGTPQCILMTMKEPKEGKYGDCIVRRVG